MLSLLPVCSRKQTYSNRSVSVACRVAPLPYSVCCIVVSGHTHSKEVLCGLQGGAASMLSLLPVYFRNQTYSKKKCFCGLQGGAASSPCPCLPLRMPTGATVC